MSWEMEQIGPHTLYRGDCREVLSTIPDVDTVICDPPYGVGLTAKVTKHARRTTAMLYPDTPGDSTQLTPVLVAWMRAHAQRAVVTPGIRMLWTYPQPDAMGCIFATNGAGIDRWGFGCFHPILYYGRCPYMAAGLGSRPNSFASSHPGMHVTKEDQIAHPCPKPLAWRLWLVNRGSLPGETVCDPVMGSGTTGVACVQLGRRFTGIEIERQYFDIACQRMHEAMRQPDLFVSPPPPVQQRLFAREAS